MLRHDVARDREICGGCFRIVRCKRIPRKRKVVFGYPLNALHCPWSVRRGLQYRGVQGECAVVPAIHESPCFKGLVGIVQDYSVVSRYAADGSGGPGNESDDQRDRYCAVRYLLELAAFGGRFDLCRWIGEFQQEFACVGGPVARVEAQRLLYRGPAPLRIRRQRGRNDTLFFCLGGIEITKRALAAQEAISGDTQSKHVVVRLRSISMQYFATCVCAGSPIRLCVAIR